MDCPLESIIFTPFNLNRDGKTRKIPQRKMLLFLLLRDFDEKLSLEKTSQVSDDSG